METHYYLINGTVKKGSKMPDEKDIDTLRDYKQHYNNWLSSLQPCDIDESELKKIKEHLMFYIGEPPIDITDIVSAQVICTATRCDGECIECNHMSIGITFKQPKQVESECEAVEFLIEQSFKLGVQWGETYGGWFNPNKEDNERKLKECKETVKQLYQIFKTDNVEKF